MRYGISSHDIKPGNLITSTGYWDVITHPYSNSFTKLLLVNNYMPLFYTNVITCLCPYHCAGLAIFYYLTHWGPVTHICIDNIASIGSGNGLSPGRRQAIIWTNAGISLIWPLRTNFSEILIKILASYSRKCIWKCHLGFGSYFVSASLC